MKQNRGFFVTFEGGEGSGKSTQIRLLADALRGQGSDVVLTREPGGTPEAETIRAILVRKDGGHWTPMAETLLFFAARVMNVQTLIRPALEAEKIVLCDRFTDSTRAYQCYGHGLDLGHVESFSQLALGGFEPDLTLILDLDVRTGLERSGKRLAGAGSDESRFESLDVAFHERLRAGYLDIAGRNPERCVVVNADRPMADVAADIQTIVLERLA